MRRVDGLKDVLRALPRLRSLSIFAPALHEDSVFVTLASLKRDLPNLDSLALQCYDGSVLPSLHAQTLAAFLRDRRVLRRLYSNFEVPPESMAMYLDSIATLKNLEIFDLRMTNQAFTHVFISDMLTRLPTGLAAMKLTSKGTLVDPSVFSLFVSNQRTLTAVSLTRDTYSGHTSLISSTSISVHGQRLT